MSRRLSVGAMVVALGCVPALARAQEGAAVAPVIVRPEAAPAKNTMVTPIASHPAALLAVKSAVAATTIYAAHRVSKQNKAAAIGMLLAVNSAYAIIVAHNYRVSSGR